MDDQGVTERASSVVEDEMSLRDYGAIVLRRKWWVLAPMVLAVVGAAAWSLTQPQRYRASADVLLTQPPTASSIGAPQQAMQTRVLQNELRRAEGSALVALVREEIGDGPALRVRLAAEEDSDVFVFTAESSDARLAAEAADTYAAVFIDDRRERLTADIERNIAVFEDRVDALDEQIERAGDAAAGDDSMIVTVQREEYVRQLEALRTSLDLAESSGATVIDAARVPSSPFEPTPVRTAVLALVVGLLLGLGAAFLRDYLDQVLRDEDDLRRATGRPVLGVIPRLRDWRPTDTHVVVREAPLSPPAEAYRGLRTALQFLRSEGALRTIQVTSPKPADGKTTTSANLAVAYGRGGQRVVLVDCDLRRPRVHHFFGLPNDLGFTGLLLGTPLDEVVQKVDGEVHLSVISSGPVPLEPSELLSDENVAVLLATLAERFDVVVIDSPPVLAVADPLVLAGIVDGVILVASAATTNRRQAARAAELLDQVDAPTLGTVLNAFEPHRGTSYDYRYSYGYADSRT